MTRLASKKNDRLNKLIIDKFTAKFISKVFLNLKLRF